MGRFFGKGILLLVVVWPLTVWAQVATTTVTDTVYHADGTKAGGLVIVSWSAFTTASGQAVPGGSTSVTIGANGVLSLQLAPNQGATPAGQYYTAVYHLDDGSVSREYWTVPVSATAVTLSAVRSSVLPAAVAVQTVSKSYVDNAVAAALAGQPGGGNVTFLNRTGDAMVGPLALSGDPSTGTQAANKHYVDTAIAQATVGLAQKVSLAPGSTQAVAQGAGTELQVNRLNNVEYASQFVGGRGGNGLANAVSSPECVNGCQVTVEQEYGSPEAVAPTTWSSSGAGGTHVHDLRGGGVHDYFLNPVSQALVGMDTGQTIDVTSTRSAASVFQATGAAYPQSTALSITHRALTGGSNQFPAQIPGANGHYFKSNYVALQVAGTYNTMGQHVLAGHSIECYGVGDCLIGGQFITASGGFRDDADEGAHPMDLQIHEDTKVFVGSCGTGCTPGSTTVGVTVTAAQGTQGDGRYLLNMNPSKTISTGQLVGGAVTANGFIGPTATFTGTTFPVSVFLRTASVIPGSATAKEPGTVLVGIVTNGLPSPFSASTAALPATSGVACVTDAPNGFNPTNFEMAAYTTADAVHLTMTLNKVHGAGATVTVGGLCGYGLEQTVDTTNGIRQVFPVIGASSATSLYYAGGLTPIVGVTGATSAYVHVALPVATIARTGGTVTVTTAGAFPKDLSGLMVTVAGVADGSLNGQFAATTTGPSTLTFPSTGADTVSSGGTVSVLTGGYVLYPMAEVLSVYNQATKAVDGQMTLAANNVSWAPGDAVEEPHYFQENVAADVSFVGQTVPRPVTLSRAGIQYENNVGPGTRGWSIANAAPASNYFGNGGTHGVPDDALEVIGAWNRTLETQAGETSLFQVHCNSHGCGKWNSAYNLFELDSAAGGDVLNYQPATSALNLNLRGTSYGFTPQGFSAKTVNAAALNVSGMTLTGSARLSGGTTIFGSGVPLLTPNATSEAYLQALSSGSNNAGVFVSRASTGAYASLDIVTGPVGNTGWSLQMQPNSTDVVLADRATGGSAMVCKSGQGCNFPEGLTAPNARGVLAGTTGVIGGGALAAGACTTGTAAVSGAAVGAPVAVSAVDGSLPSGLVMVRGAVTSAGIVTVQVCAVSAVTPAAVGYNVRVLQ